MRLRLKPRALRVADQFACDAATTERRDPTGTLPLQRQLAAELSRRWQRVRVAVGAQIGKADLLALSPTSATAAALSGQDKVGAAQSWVDATLRQVVVGHDDGVWLSSAVERAYAAGAQRASRTTGRPVSVDQARSGVHGAAAVAELEGIAEAVSQRVVRSVVGSLIAGDTPTTAARRAASAVNDVGVPRGKMLAAMSVVRAYSEGTLDGLAGLGVRRVSLVPELAVVTKVAATDALTEDAPRRTQQPRRASTGQFRPYASRLGAQRQSEIRRAESRLGQLGMVNVLNMPGACERCQSIAEDGPYTIDEARGLVPAHPSCRCAFDPVGGDFEIDPEDFDEEDTE